MHGGTIMNQQQKDYLCQSIKTNRKRLNLTQEALAKVMGYTKQTISNWETGKNTPSSEDIEKLAEVFHVDPNTLISQNPLNTNAISDLELIEIMPIPNKVFTYALFFKNNVNCQWQAWIYDMDYAAMIFSGYSCTECDDYPSFKKDFLSDINKATNFAREYMDYKGIDIV